MNRGGDVSINESCGVFQVADLIGKKWTIALLGEIVVLGNQGFNALLHRMGKISPKILTERLKELEQQQLIRKTVDTKSVPMKTAYFLTDKGKELQDILMILKQWQKKYHTELPCGRVTCADCIFFRE
ncbi:MAG: helix-turn-helix domain-containing protein [Nanoarchaeota archaeon]|nr:helix-turn-helix domain-containing protein [Nanoarchaeota archaeon]